MSSRSIKMADENVSDVTRTRHAHVASVNILVLTLVLISQVLLTRLNWQSHVTRRENDVHSRIQVASESLLRYWQDFSVTPKSCGPADQTNLE